MWMYSVRRGGLVRVSGVLVAAILGLSACGSTEDTASESGETSGQTDDTGTPSKGTLELEEAAESAQVREADWSIDPQDVRDQIGAQFTYNCPPGGRATSIWGVETYTDDSSVCSAAVHVGLITAADGGEVTIEIAEALESYESGIANDIESGPWGSWDGSFIFPAAPPGTGTFETAAPAAEASYLSEAWSLTISALPFEAGDTYTHDCPPGGETGSVWGTGSYTADSSICSAAVHAGLITTESGGDVPVRITEGLEVYEASEANGVSSSEWGSYALSFEVG